MKATRDSKPWISTRISRRQFLKAGTLGGAALMTGTGLNSGVPAIHSNRQPNFLFMKVPLILSCPGRILEGAQDRTHLVSGLDIVPTICDYAEVKQPERTLGRSLRPLLEGKKIEWHESVAAEVQKTGRMIRTQDYKYITYYGDPVEQLFDMKDDPGETKNLAAESEYAAILEDHRKLLKEWEAQLDVADE